MPGCRLTGPRGVAGYPRRHERVGPQFLEPGGPVGGARHVGGGSHHRRPVRIDANLATNVAVVRRKPEPADQFVARRIAARLTALMVHEVAQVFLLTTLVRRRADYPVRHQQFDHQEPAAAPRDELTVAVQHVRRVSYRRRRFRGLRVHRVGGMLHSRPLFAPRRVGKWVRNPHGPATVSGERAASDASASATVPRAWEGVAAPCRSTSQETRRRGIGKPAGAA